MSISEKTAYLKGLLEGLNIDKTKPEGKLITAMVDVLDEMANDIKVLYSENDHVNDYLDELDSDLGDVEEYLFCDDDECEDCEGCDGCDGDWDDDEEYTVCDDCDAETCEGCEFAEEEEEQ